MHTDIKDFILNNEVTDPQPGQLLQAVMVRRPYASKPSIVLVDSGLFAKAKATAMATMSAGVAPGNSDCAMSRAVRTCSYMATAAECSAKRPNFSNCFDRTSKASVPSVNFMGVLFGVGGNANNTHRNAGSGYCKFWAAGAA